MKKLSKILIDLDGVLAENGAFPEVGEPTKGMRDFVEKCITKGIKVILWSARFNGGEEGHNQFGTTCRDQLLKVNDWIFNEFKSAVNDFCVHEKAWSEADHHADVLIDDRCIEFLNADYLEKRLFESRDEILAKAMYEETKDEDFNIVCDVEVADGEGFDKEYILMRVLEMRAKDK